jgi:hypothetical protein
MKKNERETQNKKSDNFNNNPDTTFTRRCTASFHHLFCEFTHIHNTMQQHLWVMTRGVSTRTHARWSYCSPHVFCSHSTDTPIQPLAPNPTHARTHTHTHARMHTTTAKGATAVLAFLDAGIAPGKVRVLVGACDPVCEAAAARGDGGGCCLIGCGRTGGSASSSSDKVRSTAPAADGADGCLRWHATGRATPLTYPKYRHTDQETDRWTDRQTDRQTDRHIRIDHGNRSQNTPTIRAMLPTLQLPHCMTSSDATRGDGQTEGRSRRHAVP